MVINSKVRRRVSIIELCEAHVDCVNRTAPVVDFQTPFKMIRTTNVRDGFIDTENVRHVTEPTYKKWTRRLIPKRGDVILTREAPLGEVGKIRTDDQIFLGQRLYQFRTNPQKLDADFLLYSLLDDDLQGQIRGYGSGATVEHMRLQDIPSLEISLPPIKEQHKIAAILSAYDDLIENNLRRIKILEEMAQNLYREWFVKFRFPGHQHARFTDSPLGRIPEGWEVKTLGENLELNYGKALKHEDRRRGEVPVYGSSGVVGYHDVPLVNGPGIVVGRKGNVGSVFWSDKNFYPIDTTYFVTSRMPLRFLFYDLQTKNFLNNDAAVPGLNRNQAYSLETVAPPADILIQFCQFADDFEQQAAILRLQNTTLRRTRDLLLPRLISGEVDVSELYIAVPEEAQA
jgi:type I restriction enzyme, S subunit